jgi:lysophospholipase L1-like esterase
VSRSVQRIGVVAVITLALLMAWQRAQGGEQQVASGPFNHGIVVVGDSITARYNDQPGDQFQAWWSIVGRHFGARVTTHAQSGSGYLRQGLECSGNRFIDRPEAFRKAAPSVFIVEGGRNDWSSCIEGVHVESTNHQVSQAVNHYLDVLQASLPHTTRIIVLGPPWGPIFEDGRQRVTAIIRAAAHRHGVMFVNTDGTLDRLSRVVDGVHPNLAGSTALADRVITALS